MMSFPVPLNKVCLMRKRSENGQKLPNNSLRKNKTMKLVKLPFHVLKLRDSSYVPLQLQFLNAMSSRDQLNLAKN